MSLRASYHIRMNGWDSLVPYRITVHQVDLMRAVKAWPLVAASTAQAAAYCFELMA